MRHFRGDLHIHTLLSPCGDLEMTPLHIADRAARIGLDIIGITDHNSTKNAMVVKKAAEGKGIFTLTGAEVTTREEVHCLAFFEKEEQLTRFQQFLDDTLMKVPNDEHYFGYQPVVDEAENILELIPHYLPAALKAGIKEVQELVYALDGLFIPAHIDRPANGIISQLGFIPPSLQFDALGLSKLAQGKDVRKQYVLQNKTTLIRNSDAHFLKQIGEIYSVFHMEEVSFAEIRKALRQENNRFVEMR